MGGGSGNLVPAMGQWQGLAGVGRGYYVGKRNGHTEEASPKIFADPLWPPSFSFLKVDHWSVFREGTRGLRGRFWWNIVHSLFENR